MSSTLVAVFVFTLYLEINRASIMDNSDLKTQLLEYLFDQCKSTPLDRVNMNSFIADRGGNPTSFAFEMNNADLVCGVQSARTGFIRRSLSVESAELISIFLNSLQV